MNKKIAILLLTLISIYNTGCSQETIDEKRKKTMVQITDLILKSDYPRLYNIIDTSFNKEGLDFDISFLNKKLLKRKSEILKNNFKLFDDKSLKDDSNYKLRVYLKNDRFDYIDIVFNFNQNVYKKIYSLNKNAHEKVEEKLKLIKSPPTEGLR